MSDDEPRSASVETLTTFGVRTDAARTFVALTVRTLFTRQLDGNREDA